MISPIVIQGSGLLGAKVLFVGEAPGGEEEKEGKPFVGEAGNVLITCLGRNGVNRDEVRIENLCKHRPPGNKFEALIDSDELKRGLHELQDYIDKYRPNVIGALGAKPLAYLAGKSGITKWRGSILETKDGIKIIPTYHPAFVARDRSVYPIFDQDIKRIIQDSQFPERRLPVRKFVILESSKSDEIELWTKHILNQEKVAVDIETVRKSTHILCVGFGISPELGICFVCDQSMIIRDALSRILTSSVKKIFHFGTFDTEMLRINGYETNNYWWDTLIAQHVLAPELPKELAYLTSVYTREPYYKQEGRGELPGDIKSWSLKTTKEAVWRYNCKDVCVTIEIQQHQEREIKEESWHYRRTFDYEMSMLEVAAHISRTGMLIDSARRKEIEMILIKKWTRLQFFLNGLSGLEINVKSPKVKDLLFEKLKLPPRRKRTGQLTADEDAIVGLMAYVQDYITKLKREDVIFDWQVKFRVLKLILEIRGIRQLLSNYVGEKVRISDDGRIRSTYKVAGAETGRWSAEKYIDGSGVAAMTFPREYLEVPDDEPKDQINPPLPESVVQELDDDGGDGESDSGGDESVS